MSFTSTSFKAAQSPAVGAFVGRIGDALDGEFHVFGRHLAETVGEADFVPQFERDGQVVQLFEAFDRNRLPAPFVAGHVRGKARIDGAHDIAFGCREPEGGIKDLKVAVGADLENHSVLRPRNPRREQARGAEGASG